MTIGMRQGSVVTEIGPGGVMHSLMSTIAVHLEDGRWGSRSFGDGKALPG